MKKKFGYWIKKNWYYHQYIAKIYQLYIPQNSSVLQIGCKNGYLLANLKASYAVGVEADLLIANEAIIDYKNIKIYNFLDQVPVYKFDFIILSSTVHEVADIQDLFVQLQQYCSFNTRIIIDFYSSLWEPILWITKELGFRRETPLINWLTFYDLKNFLYLADFDIVLHQKKMIIPCYIPFFSWFFNTFIANIPLINRFCLMQFFVARTNYSYQETLSTSVIIPCKNEKGNIEQAILRCPNMGSFTEIIFVEGGSVDGTADAIQEMIKKYPQKKIVHLVQDGKGKGDAVRKGFSYAKGDVLMIQDADLTAPPEDLPKFFNALIQSKGEFINGSRLIYGMEEKAMRFLNMIANHLFALSFSWLLGQKIKDTLCGTKVLFKKDYEKIVKNRSYFGDFDPFGDFDLLFGAAKLHLKIIDLPVHYKQRTYGSTQIRRFYHGLLLIKMSFIGLKKFKLY